MQIFSDLAYPDVAISLTGGTAVHAIHGLPDNLHLLQDLQVVCTLVSLHFEKDPPAMPLSPWAGSNAGVSGEDLFAFWYKLLTKQVLRRSKSASSLHLNNFFAN